MNRRLLIYGGIVSFLFVLSSVIYLLIRSAEPVHAEKQVVFMDSYRIFEEFDMKKDYDRMLEDELMNEQLGLDSLGRQVNNSTGAEQAEHKKKYALARQDLESRFKALSDRYTGEIYQRLNEDIKAYGKEKGYGMILGSNGKGTVMYVDSLKDITGDLLTYLNTKYRK